METVLNGLMADNGCDYPTEELRNIFAASCVESVARRFQFSTIEMYKRIKRVELYSATILIPVRYSAYKKLRNRPSRHSQSFYCQREEIK